MIAAFVGFTLIGACLGTAAGALFMQHLLRVHDAPTVVITPKPAAATGRLWVGLTVAEDAADSPLETAGAEAAFAQLQAQISDGRHVDVVSGTTVELVQGSTVVKSFQVA